MPRQLVFSRVPVDLSIVEYDLVAGEDVFLTYTWGLETGPPIYRDGEGPPYMPLSRIDLPQIDRTSRTQITTHHYGLRLGTWLIQKDMYKAESDFAERVYTEALQDKIDPNDISAIQQAKDELNNIAAHDKVFLRKYRGHKIIGLQGCGDLTMNLWNVAYVNNRLAQKPPVLLCLPKEDLELRTYSCLVKWKPINNRPPRITIEEVQFERWNNKTKANPMVWLRYGDKWLPRGDSVEFAISNQQVIRNGKIVPVVTTCHQFSDIRHLIKMPNINPKRQLYPGEPLNRHYFGNPKEGDIWFGEKAFLEDESRNLLRAALTSPVVLEFTPGADKQRLRGALEQAGYQEVYDPLEPLTRGRWRFVPRSTHVNVVEIFFKRNTYGWTMVGLSQDATRLLCLACTGKAGETGYVLEEAAEILLRAGAWNALLIDEGGDVFQKMCDVDGRLVDMVKSERRRLRAVFVMAKPKPAEVKRNRRPGHSFSPRAGKGTSEGEQS